MDLNNEGASIITEEEEDRLSNLPDGITYHILSFMDMKYAVQTSMLSRKWKQVWTSMPQLNINSGTFSTPNRFRKFVKHALLHRNDLSEVSAVKLNYKGPTTQSSVTDIVNYVYLHNLTQLNMTWSSGIHLPERLFNSHTLKHLTLANEGASSRNTYVPSLVWDTPALETVKLTSIRFGDDTKKNINFFSKCVNLEEITIHNCSMKGVESFDICVPHLSKLRITNSSVFPKVFNVVAPQLETLAVSTTASSFPEGLTSPSNFLHLSAIGFNALEKAHVSLSSRKIKKERNLPSLLELFRILHKVKFLILDVDVIEILSVCLYELSDEPCPFDDLKSLKIDATSLKHRRYIPTLLTNVRNYLLANSPNATFIVDLPKTVYRNGKRRKYYMPTSSLSSMSLDTSSPSTDDSWDADDSRGYGYWAAESRYMPFSSRPAEVSLKRSRPEVDSDTVTSKVTKFEAQVKLPMTTVLEKKMLEEKIQRQDQVTSQQKAQIADDFRDYWGADSRYTPYSSRPAEVSLKRSRPEVDSDTVTSKVAKFEAEEKLPTTTVLEKKMLEEKVQRQDQVISQQKAQIQEQFQANEQQLKKIRNQDQVISQQNAKIQMHDRVIAKYKTMFSEKIKEQDQLVAKERETFKKKVETQDQVIKKLKGTLEKRNSQHGKLISEIFKCKMAEFKMQVESKNPDYEVICSVGRDIKSAIDMTPSSLKANVEAEFSFQYEMLKCLLLTRTDASQWAQFETALGNIKLSEGAHSGHGQSQSRVHAAEPSLVPRPSPANVTTSSRVVSAASEKVVQPSQRYHM